MNLSNLIFVPGRGYFRQTSDGKADYSQPVNNPMVSSPEEQAKKAELGAFLRSQFYNPNNSYQSHWIGALDSRMNERLQGKYNTGSRYEYQTRLTDRDGQSQMYARNNIIEDMYRNGYSKRQIAQHLNGTANIADMKADWYDYDDRMTGYYKGAPAPFKSPTASNSESAFKGGMLSGLGDMREKIFQSLGMLGKK